MRFLLFFLLIASLEGCIYRMPDNNHIALSPNTNNPQFTGEKPKGLPGL